jgi:hypothetical protein
MHLNPGHFAAFWRKGALCQVFPVDLFLVLLKCFCGAGATKTGSCMLVGVYSYYCTGLWLSL